ALRDMVLPRQSLTPLSGHSFVALQTPRRLCYSVSCHTTPRPRFPAGTTLSPPLAALHHPSLLGPATPAILYRLEIAKHLSAMAILLQLLSHRRPDRLGYLAWVLAFVGPRFPTPFSIAFTKDASYLLPCNSPTSRQGNTPLYLGRSSFGSR